MAVKAAAFAMLLRVLIVAFGDERLMTWGTGWPPALALMAVLTMTVANLVAGRQTSVKRMLAYSSIAHAGYALVGVVATMRSADGQASVLFYLLTYTVSTVGAFGALIYCGSRGAEATSYEDLAGLAKRHPAAALAFSVFLLSLAGLPPNRGFLRQALRLPRGHRRRAVPARGAGPAQQLARRLLLPARHGLHVHARTGTRRAAGGAHAVGLRDQRAGARCGAGVRLGIAPGWSLDMAAAAKIVVSVR